MGLNFEAPQRWCLVYTCVLPPYALPWWLLHTVPTLPVSISPSESGPLAWLLAGSLLLSAGLPLVLHRADSKTQSSSCHPLLKILQWLVSMLQIRVGGKPWSQAQQSHLPLAPLSSPWLPFTSWLMPCAHPPGLDTRCCLYLGRFLLSSNLGKPSAVAQTGLSPGTSPALSSTPVPHWLLC